MRKPSLAKWAGGLSSLLLLAGAVGSGAASAQSVHRAGYHGTIVFALPPQTNITWYLPFSNGANASLYNFQLIDQLYVPLLYVNPQYKFDYNDQIAQKIVANSQGTVYHVYMNPKYHWSDGTPVTSKDVLFTWKLIQILSNPKAPQPWPWYGAGSGGVPANIQSVVANGPYEFTVTLKKPANQQWFEYNGLGDFTPYPEQAWDKYPNNPTAEAKWLGQQATSPSIDSVVDGPYKIASALSNQEWILVPNPSFDGHKATARIIFQYEASSEAEFTGLRTGTVQVGYLPLADWGARLELPDHMVPNYGLAYFDIELNFHKDTPGGLGPVFSQLYVRQALEMGIDQQSIINVIYHGFAAPEYGPIPTKPKTVFLDPRLTKPLYPFNLAAAKKLLESHGWHLVNGVMTKGNTQLAFTMMYSSGDLATDEWIQLVQHDWAQIGVKVTLKPTPFATLIGLMSKSNDWQCAGAQGIIYGGSYPSGGTLFGYNLPGQPGPGGLNDMGWNDPTENQLIIATHTPWPNAQVNLQHFFAYEYYTAKELVNLWTPNFGTITELAPNVNVPIWSLNATTGQPLMQYWSVKS
jgi:peptide/nickel transport system substrate-binding protein